MDKLAWPYDPKQVLRDLGQSGSRTHQNAAKRLRRGVSLTDTVAQAPATAVKATKRVMRAGESVLGPSKHVGPLVLRGLEGVGKGVQKRPGLAALALGATALAPIIASTAHKAQQEQEGQLMNAYNDPTLPMVRTASLREFREKKAAFFNPAGIGARGRVFANTVGESLRSNGVNSFANGIGSSIGQGMFNAALGGLGGVYDKLRTVLATDPKRKRLVESIIRSDQVIHDAVENYPDGMAKAMEAYSTLVRFAPSLSLDPNAVRSFLREAALSGWQGVSYATIKNLADTEKAISSKHNDRR